jgi:hypothetical protein
VIESGIPTKKEKHMGQFIYLSLITHISNSQRNSRISPKDRLSDDDLLTRAVEEFGMHRDAYERQNDHEGAHLTMKDSYLQEHLLPLLREIYPMLYSNYRCFEWEKVLKYIEDLIATEQWHAFLCGTQFPCLFPDHYGVIDPVRVDPKHTLGPTMDVQLRGIVLANEGKAYMESWVILFRFFERCMRGAFPANPLAASLRVYLRS